MNFLHVCRYALKNVLQKNLMRYIYNLWQTGS